MTQPRKFPITIVLAAALVQLAACSRQLPVDQPAAEPGPDAGAVAKDTPVTSGLQPGESVGVFQVVKAGGADDGVEVGQQLCYC